MWNKYKRWVKQVIKIMFKCIHLCHPDQVRFMLNNIKLCILVLSSQKLTASLRMTFIFDVWCRSTARVTARYRTANTVCSHNRLSLEDKITDKKQFVMTKPRSSPTIHFYLYIQTFYCIFLHSSYPFGRFPIVVLPKFSGSLPEINEQVGVCKWVCGQCSSLVLIHT